MPSSHLIICHPLLLLPSVFPRIGVFSSEFALHIRWPKYWSFSFIISPSNEYSGLISFRIDLFDLLAVQGDSNTMVQKHQFLLTTLSLIDFFLWWDTQNLSSIRFWNQVCDLSWKEDCGFWLALSPGLMGSSSSTGFLWNLYAGQEATVRTGHGTVDWLKVGKRVHQGCILSPCLFNLYAEYITQNVELDEAQTGIKIARRNINNLRYADDTTLKAESKELKSLLIKVKEESEKVGLKLNIQ